VKLKPQSADDSSAGKGEREHSARSFRHSAGMTKQTAAKPHKYQLRRLQAGCGEQNARAPLSDHLLARFAHCTLSA
jgi:hypothetical protein